MALGQETSGSLNAARVMHMRHVTCGQALASSRVRMDNEGGPVATTRTAAGVRGKGFGEELDLWWTSPTPSVAYYCDSSRARFSTTTHHQHQHPTGSSPDLFSQSSPLRSPGAIQAGWMSRQVVGVPWRESNRGQALRRTTTTMAQTKPPTT